MTETDLEALAAKVEALDGPCRETDAEIADAVLGPVKPPYRRGHCEKYTGSIDSAMSLVPEGYDWILCRANGGLTIHAEVGNREQIFGETPAIALTTAALRARLSPPPTEVKDNG